MKLIFKAIVIVMFSPVAMAHESCADWVGGFSALMRCWGTATDLVSGQSVDFTIDLNSDYLEEKNGSLIFVYNRHSVEMTRPFLKFFTRTSFASFVHFQPDCVRQGQQVRCSGREDDRRFVLNIDLITGTATGTYQDERFANPTAQRSFAFTAANPLDCR